MGPSRGSAGGCLLSFLLDIISINPIHYDLSFDRFFSKDKALSGTLPDIDSDFQASRRKEVINYIKNKYGEDKVAGVVSYSTLQGKNALKDVLRVHSACDFSQMNKITELIPARDKISDQLAEFKEETGSDSILFYCLKNEPDLLKDYCTLQEVNGVNIFSGDYGDYFKIAIGIESAIKSSSRHPSAIVISKYPIVDVAPLVRDKSSDELIIDYDMDYFPYASLVKFDILGIKSLDCLDEVNKLLIEIGIL
jgi:DNA polymerase-3 subunit alpha